MALKLKLLEDSFGANIEAYNTTAAAMGAVDDTARDPNNSPTAKTTLKTAHTSVAVASVAAKALLPHLKVRWLGKTKIIWIPNLDRISSA